MPNIPRKNKEYFERTQKENNIGNRHVAWELGKRLCRTVCILEHGLKIPLPLGLAEAQYTVIHINASG